MVPKGSIEDHVRIGKKFAYDYKVQVFEKDPRRHSDIYVFACHHHMDKGTVDPLDLSQWTFYVVPTVRIINTFARRILSAWQQS
jgi:hypothetical protein